MLCTAENFTHNTVRKVLAEGKETWRICDRNLGCFSCSDMFFYANEIITSGGTFLSVIWKMAAHFGWGWQQCYLVLSLLPRASCLALIGFAFCNSDFLKVEASVIVMWKWSCVPGPKGVPREGNQKWWNCLFIRQSLHAPLHTYGPSLHEVIICRSEKKGLTLGFS